MLTKHKLKKPLLVFLALLFSIFKPPGSCAQNVGIGASSFVPNAAAMLEIRAGLANNKGLLIPRMTNAERLAMNPLPAAAQGLLVYQTNIVGASLEGFYYNTSTTVTPNWVYLSTGGGSGWGLTGDAATVPGVNFIGTTDPVDWIIKTDNQERCRVYSSGEVTVNATAFNAGEVFAVYGSNTTGATNAVGADAIVGHATDNGIGVWGITTGATTGNKGNTGVRGDNTSTTTPTGITSHGVYGSNQSVPSGTGITIGVGGYATASTLDARGVNGQSQSANGIGVAGFNTAPSASNFNAHGVYGQSASQLAFGVCGVNTSVLGAAHGVQGTSSSVGAGAGVRGFNNNAPGSGGSTYGVRGSANGIPTGSGAAYGVRGDCSTLTGTAYGVFGTVATPTGFGLSGSNTNVSGTGIIGTGNNVGGNYIIGGSGGAFSGNTMGAFAIGTSVSAATGVLGVSNGAPLTTHVAGSGVSGSSDIIGVAGWANSATADDRAGGYFDANAGTSFAYVGAISALGVNRKIEGNGTVNTTVKDLHDNLVVLSCPEAPENLFQDFGKGQLNDGKTHISLDPVFSKNIVVNEKHPLRVFIQLGGDCKGVFVNNESQSGFDVTELQGGKSNAPFTWFVTANRADEKNADGTISKYSSERFSPAIGPAPSVKKEKTKAPDALINTVDKPSEPVKAVEIDKNSPKNR